MIAKVLKISFNVKNRNYLDSRFNGSRLVKINKRKATVNPEP